MKRKEEKQEARASPVTFAAESAVHEGLTRVLLRIYEKHRLRVSEVRVSWSVLNQITQVEVTMASAPEVDDEEGER